MLIKVHQLTLLKVMQKEDGWMDEQVDRLEKQR